MYPVDKNILISLIPFVYLKRDNSNFPKSKLKNILQCINLVNKHGILHVSELMSDCCLTPTQQFFQLYHGEKLIFNKMIMRSVLYNTNSLSWISIALALWNNSPRIDMSLHSDTSWFRVNRLCSFSLMLCV